MAVFYYLCVKLDTKRGVNREPNALRGSVDRIFGLDRQPNPGLGLRSGSSEVMLKQRVAADRQPNQGLGLRVRVNGAGMECGNARVQALATTALLSSSVSYFHVLLVYSCRVR